MFINEAEGEVPQIKISANDIVFILILLIPTLVLGLYFSPMVDFAQSCLSMLTN